MASLTHTSIVARKTIRYTLYAIIGFTIFRGALLTAIKIYRYYFPPPPPPAKAEFGKLPKIPFPETDYPESLTFSLETPEGTFPKFSHLAKVYIMPKIRAGLLSLETARETASSLGYSAEGSKITETIYQFPHAKSPASLQISIATGVFSISYDLSQDPTPLEQRPVPPEVAVSKIKSYLSSANLLPDDLTGEIKSEYVKLTDNKIIGAQSLSDANFVKVNFFRRAYNELPSVTSNPTSANVWFIVSGDPTKEKMVIASQYHYYPVDENISSTYLIKKADAAWNDLVSGKAYIASVGQSSQNKNITIRRMYLAYYDSGVLMNFYQPVIVFEGDGGFVAYTQAITDENFN